MKPPPKFVMLAPHHDDETLFASALAVEHRPHLIVCTCGDVQAERGSAVTPLQRAEETYDAWAILVPGGSVEAWAFTDNPLKTDWNAMAAEITKLPDHYDVCVAPLWEDLGHEHHNHVAHYAMEAFGPDRMIQYATYRRGHGRTVTDHETPPGAEWIRRKLLAMACYRSQIEEPSTRAWFLGPLNEYVADAPVGSAR